MINFKECLTTKGGNYRVEGLEIPDEKSGASWTRTQYLLHSRQMLLLWSYWNTMAVEQQTSYIYLQALVVNIHVILLALSGYSQKVNVVYTWTYNVFRAICGFAHSIECAAQSRDPQNRRHSMI